VSTGYLLDANVFIEASRRYYGFDIVPAFWSWLDQKQFDEDIASITSIYDELADYGDELSDWVKVRKGNDWWLDITDHATQEAYREVVAWVMAHPSFKPEAKDDFLAGADPWLIAKAKVLGVSIVTHEKLDLNAKKKVYIPVVCEHFGVACLDTFQLMRSFGDSLG